MKDANKAITKPPPGLPPLPLSQTENGALATAPLSTVVNSATDALYQDVYNLVHGEIKIVSVAANAAIGGVERDAAAASETKKSNVAASGGAGGSESQAASVEEQLTRAALGVTDAETKKMKPAAAASKPSASTNTDVLETRKQKMANLSFAQRRHELTRRIVQHSKSLGQVYALTAASLPKSHSALLQQKALKSSSSVLAGSPTSASKVHDPPPRLGATVEVSSDALQYVKSGWVSQDEAQDALYFHHDGLWKARGHCHDVLGALCVLSTPLVGEVVGGDDDAMEVESKVNATYKGGGGIWPDFPTDVALAVDRYDTSQERSYSESELQARLASAVRRKLVLGEVGAFGTIGSAGGDSENNEAATPKTVTDASSSKQSTRGEDIRPLPWRVVLGKGGGSIKLTFGTPRTVSTAEALRQRSLVDNTEEDVTSNLQQYPIEAQLSVLSESSTASWKLLSIQVQASPKTGESDHQLVMNHKQMFDLHRIGERVMIVEEAVCRKANEERPKEEEKNGGDDMAVPRPLLRLFEVAHAFALSLQMEILSSQAEALRRGAWGGGGSYSFGSASQARGGDASSECIAVSPVYFFDGQKSTSSKVEVNDGNRRAPIAVMAVHFWSCDDRYGSPRVGDLTTHRDEKKKEQKENDDASSSIRSKLTNPNQRRDDNFLPMSDRKGEKRLSLCIRAVPTVGLVVSLSGGSNTNDKGDDAVTEAVSNHMQRNVDKLLSSIQDPFQLSMSDALLAAAVLCADRRCHAVVGALNRQTIANHHLPKWIRLEVECGTISVAAIISYPTTDASGEARPPTVLFRLACDSRTGRFVPTFPRPASLLRLLACNDPSVSDIQSLRNAAMAALGGSSTKRAADGASRESTGRIVRDAFDALSRSMDTLGRKCGVGGEWNDIDAIQSSSLREKSIDQTCRDVRASLMSSCGMAAVFGVGAMALKIAGGVDPLVDMAGGPINDESNTDLLRVPPLGVPLCQRIVERLEKEGDGGTKRVAQLQGELFAVSAKPNEEALELVCFDVLTMTESASSVPIRLEYAKGKSPQSVPVSLTADVGSTRPTKRFRTAKALDESAKCHHMLEEVEYAALWMDALLRQ